MATLLGCESPCTRGKRRNYSSNIITKFTATKITGQGFSRGTQVGETTFVLTVKPLESWSTETRDLRLESSLKGRRCPRDLAGAVVAPVSSGLTNRLNITGCDFFFGNFKLWYNLLPGNMFLLADNPNDAVTATSVWEKLRWSGSFVVSFTLA